MEKRQMINLAAGAICAVVGMNSAGCSSMAPDIAADIAMDREMQKPLVLEQRLSYFPDSEIALKFYGSDLEGFDGLTKPYTCLLETDTYDGHTVSGRLNMVVGPDKDRIDLFNMYMRGIGLLLPRSTAQKTFKDVFGSITLEQVAGLWEMPPEQASDGKGAMQDTPTNRSSMEVDDIRRNDSLQDYFISLYAVRIRKYGLRIYEIKEFSVDYKIQIDGNDVVENQDQ